MLSHQVPIRVRYAETDKMGYVYYGNYATYYEIARVELFRSMGIVYKDMEDQGVLMPVLDYQTKFIRPATYDEELTVKVWIPEPPGTRVRFLYEIYNEKGTLINTGETTLVFVSAHNGRPCNPPQTFVDCTQPYFSDEQAL